MCITLDLSMLAAVLNRSLCFDCSKYCVHLKTPNSVTCQTQDGGMHMCISIPPPSCWLLHSIWACVPCNNPVKMLVFAMCTTQDGGMHMCISIPLGLSLLAAAFVLAVFWRHDGKSSGRLEAKAVEGLLLCGPHKLRESVGAVLRLLTVGSAEADRLIVFVLCLLWPCFGAMMTARAVAGW